MQPAGPARVVLLLLVLAVSELAAAHAGEHRSIDSLTHLIDESPGEPALYIARGALYTRTGDWENAESDLHRAVLLGAEVDAAFEFARLYYHTGRHAKALQSLDLYLANNADSSSPYLLKARAAREIGEFKIAVDSFDSYLMLAPTPHPGEYIEASRLHANLGDIEMALTKLDQGMLKLGLNTQLQRYAVTLELQRDREELALERWHSLEPKLGETPQWSIMFARLLLRVDRCEEADLAIQKAQIQASGQRSNKVKQALGLELDNLKAASSPTCHAHSRTVYE